jgi:hypothetical protein
MKTLKLSILALVLGYSALAGCGSDTANNDAATIISGSGGSGGGGAGGTNYDSGVVQPDAPMVEVSPPIDTSPGEVLGPGTSSAYVDCTGLTAAQCQDRIINPSTLPAGVLPQDPGVASPPGYPACNAI